MLQIVTGDALVDKKAALINRLLTLKAEQPEAQFFYLVPEHLKFDMESYLLQAIQQRQQSQQAAIIDIQVVSFTRLAWFLMPSARQKKLSLSDTGLNMLIRNVLQEMKSHLHLYRNQVNHQGFVELLRKQFEEFILGNVAVDDLLQLSETLDQREEAARLRELALLFEQFNSQLGQHKSAKLDDLVVFEQYLQGMSVNQPIYLVIDDYDYFNAQQLNLMMTMAQRFTHVWVTLPLDSSGNSIEFDPFAITVRHTLEQLKALAQQLSVEIAPDWVITSLRTGYQSNIVTVAQAFKANQQLQEYSLSAPYTTKHCHSIWQHESRHQELRHVANHIHQLVSLHGYRYRDILIVGRDLDQYARIVPPIFAQNEIPLFFDHGQSMEQYSFVSFLEVLLRFAKRRYHFDDVSILLKSGFWLPPHIRRAEEPRRSVLVKEFYHQVAMLETIMLANGFVGYRFEDLKYEWFYAERDLPYVNAQGMRQEDCTWGELLHALREAFVLEMGPALQQRRLCCTGADFAQWLYQWLEDAQIIASLVQQRDEAIHKGDLLASRHGEQVWQVLRQTLDEFYVMFQEKQLNYEAFGDLLMTGLKNSTFHVIPPALDQVMLTSIDSPQVSPRKICFVLGADAHTLPRQVNDTSLLTERQREQIAAQLLPHQYLASGKQRSNYEELLRVYRLLLSATDHIYVSFVAMSRGEQVNVSPYIAQLAHQFNWSIEIFSSHSLAAASTLGLFEFGKLSTNIQPVYQMVRYYYEQQTLLPQEVMGLLALMAARQPQLWHRLKQLFTFSRLPKNLTPNTAKALFGEILAGSISKIEMFYQDPFSHFILYGLKLRERQTFDLTPIHTGNYFHELLDRLLSEHPDITNIHLESLQQLIQHYSEQILSQPHFHIFDLNARMRAIQTILNERLQQFIKIIRYQQAQTLMRPHVTELVFGDRQRSSLEYPLNEGKLLLRGKIDRIDYSLNHQYLQVLDYKSGKKEFKLKDFVRGIDLQLMTYLKVALNEAPTMKPIGAFYQSLRQQFLTVDQELLRQIQDTHTLERMVAQQQPYKGLIVADAATMQGIEPVLVEQRSSDLYPITLKKDLSYTAKTPAYTEQEFEWMYQYVDYLFKQAGDDILSGNIALRPYKDDPYVPSLSTAFRVISGFDATRDYALYRHFDEETDLFKQIQEKLGKGEHHDTTSETDEFDV